MEKPRTVILYHGKCPDGFGGAYAAWKKFGDTAEYIPMQYGKPIPQHMDGCEIYFIDFCYEQERMDELKKIASSIIVLDHHKGVEKVATTFPGVFDSNRSGATIAWKYFHPNTPQPFLFKYLEDYDLFRFSFPDTKAIDAYITLEPYTFERWEEIISEFENSKTRDNIIERGKIYAQHTDALIEHIANSAHLVEFEGYTCYLSGTVLQAFTNYLGHTLATKQPPFAMMVRPTADGLHISLRSVDGFDTTVLARKYGGDGHPGASAFRIAWGAPIPWKPTEEEKKMKILAIETSCDETAIAIVDGTSLGSKTHFTVQGNALISQIDLHRPYGGVFPTIAKREHAKNLVPLTRAVLEEAELLHEDTQDISEKDRDEAVKALEREPDLTEQFLTMVTEIEIPDIDAIAVTAGPGLSPALWVGVSFARALAYVWHKPLVAVNHMEGHILSALAKRTDDTKLEIENITLPVLALLISGGHTELVLMRDWLSYELIGRTRDDAVGEAFDKVARMLGLPYPGGPEISKIAEEVRLEEHKEKLFELPRPMIADDTCDFSFSGLKTAVLYTIKNKAGKLPNGNSMTASTVPATATEPSITEKEKRYIAYEFENAVSDVLLSKTVRAIEKTNARTLVLGGGVSANVHIGRIFTKELSQKYPGVSLCIPHLSLSTDNAVMIALAGFYHAQKGDFTAPQDIAADGNASLT